MIMDIKERIGEYEIIKHGEIIVFNDEDIMLEISFDDKDKEEPLLLKIHFENKGGRVSSINQKIDEKTMILEFINFDREMSLGGIFEPIEIAKKDNNSIIYFSGIVFNRQETGKERLFKYSFYLKK